MSAHWRRLLRLAAFAVVAFFGFQAVSAAASGGGTASTFTPITPCRAFDTRPDFQVGDRSIPIGAKEQVDFQITGSVGQCAGIPASATAVSVNITAVNASEPTFLAAFPSGTENPGTSILNPVPNGVAYNKVDIALSADGRLTVYNEYGTIDVLADIVGFYLPAQIDSGEVSQAVLDRLDALEDVVDQLEAEGLAQQAEIDELTAETLAQQAEIDELTNDTLAQQVEIDALESKTAPMSLTKVDGYPTVVFDSVNVQLLDGSGPNPDIFTAEPTNGLGNLIIGYNEPNFDDDQDRTGSHSLIVGSGATYSGNHNVVFGISNAATGHHSVVLGGGNNEVSGKASAVVTGNSNTVPGEYAAVLGGNWNNADGKWSAVLGGWFNEASAARSSVVGGSYNDASGIISTVVGGERNDASGTEAVVVGGHQNEASGERSVVGGGSSLTEADQDDFTAP